MFGHNFYIALGNLIYSVYNGDLIYKSINPKELFREIKVYITPNEDIKDEFGTNNSFYCIFELERLIENHADPYVCFRVFQSYFNENHSIFNRRIRLELDNLIESLEMKLEANHSKSFINKYRKLTSRLTTSKI